MRKSPTLQHPLPPIPSFLPCVISNNIYNFTAVFTEYYVSNTYNLYFSDAGNSNNL